MWVVARYRYDSAPQVVATFCGLAPASLRCQELALSSVDKDERFIPRLESALVRRAIDDLSSSEEKKKKRKLR